ncbi:MAG: ribosome biogenesis GTP-binding protein YihA/YsxC [Bacteroidota bacterium]
MRVDRAEFVQSNSQVKACPEPKFPEYAFIGRSNVGKSSLINMLTGRKALAKTSGTPGKTKLINHFMINDAWYLADLPGYGYAKVSKKERNKWQGLIAEFLTQRTNLLCSFVLLDSRHPPQRIDLEFMEWMGRKELPFAMVFTKIDKLSSTQLQKNLAAYKKEMLKVWEALPPHFTTSATSKFGREPVLNFIEETNTLFAAAQTGNAR